MHLKMTKLKKSGDWVLYSKWVFETVWEGFWSVFPCFWRSTFSDFLTRFFEIFANLAHFQGRWKWKKCEKSRSGGTWSTIWVQGLREIYRSSFRQKRFFVHDPHEKDFRSSLFGYSQKKIVNRPRRGSWTKKSGDLKEENSFSKISFAVKLAY